jgi:hypothetical protein
VPLSIFLLQYRKGAPIRGILYKRNGNAFVEAYIDIDYAEAATDRRSTITCNFLDGN